MSAAYDFASLVKLSSGSRFVVIVICAIVIAMSDCKPFEFMVVLLNYCLVYFLTAGWKVDLLRWGLGLWIGWSLRASRLALRVEGAGAVSLEFLSGRVSMDWCGMSVRLFGLGCSIVFFSLLCRERLVAAILYRSNRPRGLGTILLRVTLPVFGTKHA